MQRLAKATLVVLKVLLVYMIENNGKIDDEWAHK